MCRRDLVYLAGLTVVAALLLANLLRPGVPEAFTLPDSPAPPVAIAAAGDSAWAIVGQKVYYVTLKTRGEVQNRTITVIDDEELR
ncbi:MAG: hypothetical protein ACYDA8_14090 [Deferrisomatales bacterium]